MIVVSQNAQLTTQAQSIGRVKYFPVELYCANMVPNTTYDVYVNGQNVNAFCKPYGQKLGAPMKSNSAGKLRAQYMMAVPYNQVNLINPVSSNSNLVATAQTIHFVDPFNNSSIASLPLVLKSG